MPAKLVTSYLNPDLDGLACALAYAALLGEPAQAAILGTPQGEALFLLDYLGLPDPLKLMDTHSYDDIILVDSSEPIALDGRVRLESVSEILDHRKVHEAHLFPNAKAQIELVGSCATLVTERYSQVNATITRKAAALLHAAIISNTLNFKGSVCTPRDVAAAQWLAPFSQLPPDFAQQMFKAKSDLSGAKLQQCLASDFGTFPMGCKVLGIAQIEMMGVRGLVATRNAELRDWLTHTQDQQKLDYIFLNLIELDNPCNLFFCPQASLQPVLAQALGVDFQDDCAISTPARMRKQLVPAIKAVLG